MLNRSFWKGRRVFLTGTRLQGKLAVVVAGGARRGRHRIRARAADRAEPVRAGPGRTDIRSIRGDHSRLPGAVRRGRGMPSRSRDSHGRAVGRAARLRRSDRHVLIECDGNGASAGGRAPAGSSRASSSTSRATSATRIANGSGDIARTSRWAAKIRIRIRRAAPNS